MVYANNSQINEIYENIIYNLNYPTLKSKNLDLELEKLNKDIKNDVIIFKEVVQLQGEFDYGSLNKNIISEYKIHLIKEDLISISIEFSQISGLYSISYINTYNYDLKEKKYISLNDIFKKDTSYVNKVNDKIIKDMDYILEIYCYDEELVDGFKGISCDQTFYIEENGIVICFSSYEFDKLISTPIELRITFSQFKEYLSDYITKKI